VNDYVKYGLIGALVVVLILMWRRGLLKQLGDYVVETREELKKCTWPSVHELKGSTVAVMITLALLGAFTVGVDVVVSYVIRFILG